MTALAVAIAGVSTVPAGSVPGTVDIRSDNVRLLANLPTGPGGDVAFWGTLAAAATGVSDGDPQNDGVTLVEIADPSNPREVGRVTCVGSGSVNAGQDVSLWGNLLVLSTQAAVRNESSEDCHNVNASPAPGRMSRLSPGLLIFDISRPAAPILLTNVATGCPDESGRNPRGGAHTHTLVPDPPNRRLVVYGSYPCVSIVEIPLSSPAAARFTGVVPINADDHGFLAGVTSPPPDGPIYCHDVQVHLPTRRAACAAGDGRYTQLWDLTDLEKPVTVSTIVNRDLEHHHSAAFSSDGKTLVIGEEKLTTLAASACTSGTATNLGALWFYDITAPERPVHRSYYQNPVRGPEPSGYCSAHYFNVVPLASGRDVLVAAWYRGGTVVVDFTDPSAPRTLGYYLANPGELERASFAYASYWYNGFIYVNNFGGDVVGHAELAPSKGRAPQRGLDVLRLDEPVLRSEVHLQHLNPGTQEWGAPRA